MSELLGATSKQDQLVKRIHELWERYRIQIIGVLAVLVIGGATWGGLTYYYQVRESKAASLYALLPPTGEERTHGMEAIANKYPTTGAGIYSSFQLGRKAYEDKDYDQAILWYQPLTKLSGKRSMVQFMSQNNLATAYEAKGEWDKAFEIYQQAVAAPNNISKAYAYYHMGRVSQCRVAVMRPAAGFKKRLIMGQACPSRSVPRNAYYGSVSDRASSHSAFGLYARGPR